MSDSPFAIGTEVTVRVFGHKRGRVVTIGRDGRYQIAIEQMTIWCRERDLAPIPVPKKSKRTNRAPEGEQRIEAAPVSVRIDLHGLRVEEAMARVLSELDAAIVRGADRMEIVHGKGEGRILAALHRQLRGLTVVRSFKLDPVNAGVTWVYL